MIDIYDKTKCCGCSACVAACPRKAIKMVPDEEGFLYPIVEKEKCINCGICDDICPVKNKLVDNKDVNSYVIRSKDSGILHDSTSGGFISPLALYISNNNGIVCAAYFDENYKVKHGIFEHLSYDDMAKIRGSKYVQSDLNNCFSKIKVYLNQNRLVCFIGTPCQVYGLKSFLGKDYKNLLTIDLVCKGTSSPKLWEKYLIYQKEKYKSEIEKIAFRDKSYGYHSGIMKICFKSGKTYWGSHKVDYMLKSYVTEISSRPSCYYCPFKTVLRCSDFTIYDCWHASSLVDGLKDDDRGFTNVIVRLNKGLFFLGQLENEYEIYKVDTAKAIKLDGVMMTKSSIPHPKRQEYYKYIDTLSLADLVQKFIPISNKNRVLEYIKILTFRLGLYSYLKKILKKKNW